MFFGSFSLKETAFNTTYMKIQNSNPKEIFSFEGTIIGPNEIIDIDPVVGQRLMGLYWHNPLELISEGPVVVATSNTGSPKVEFITNTEDVKEEEMGIKKVKLPSMFKKETK